MHAPRKRGEFAIVLVGLFGLMSACSNGTEPPKKLCDASNPLTLSVGEVQPAISGGCVYVSSNSSTAEYALVPYNGDLTFANLASVSITTSGVNTVTTQLQSRTPGALATLNLLANQSSASLQPSTAFETGLRQSERRVLTRLIPAAHAWQRSHLTANGRLQPSFSIATSPPAVGDTIMLNTNSGDLAAACTTAVFRPGRIAAISNTAIVVDDVNNPAGGYTDAEYQQIATQFDTVFTMDTTAFGAPTDIDGNGHVILFFTRAVNELTPTGSPGGIVGGFFYARDLFPKQDVSGIEGCPSSNFAEMFYLLVPDPNGVVNGNDRTKFDVSHLTVVTTAHEFQHLINAARRLYVNTAATDFEETWLNEGLSHTAEELLFYKQSDHLAPRMDVDSLQFKTDTININAYNFDQAQNLGRFRLYLAKPSTNSPYATNDSLATRGATWSFLRYAADHRGASGDADTWKLLVNSTTTGLTNLQTVFGSGLPSIFRDWAIATVTDDIPGVATEWQQPSWNFRSMFNLLSTKKYPLSTVTVGDNAPLTVSLNGGGAAYVRFGVPSGQVGSLKWTTASTAVVMSLVRLK
ncbi:MAG TPA: hypothetical protein VGH98_11425 [Gemmatimonadaceae bacterium]|jgi:hypothetical protein